MRTFWKKKPTDKDTGKPDDKPDSGVPASDVEAHPEPAAGPSVDDVAPQTPTTPPEPAATDNDGDAPASAGRPGWRKRLAGSGFARGLSSVFTRNPILDDALLDELEAVLITADVGVNASMELVEDLRTRMHQRKFRDAHALLDALREMLVAQLEPVEQPLDVDRAHPFVTLVVGVNGVGKTTSIGKLANHYQHTGHKVLLAAGDTFRAAAVEQLKAWGERNHAPVVAQGQGADSASVIYDALDAARAREVDVLIADTAGRLHTQSGLMDELAKIVRVLKKLDADAPHEILMVIDGTTGQNAINQLRQFHEAAGVTGLIVTKLDGTAKGGVVFALAREFGLPIRFVGLGEGIDDLRPFAARAFVDGLLPADLGAPDAAA